MEKRVVMLVDLDYFFAQVEEVRNPLIREKPVVVCVYSGRTEDSGVVSTANYLARGYGVKSGSPIFQAKRKLEKTDAVFLPVDYDYYEKVSEEIMDILRSYADHFEQAGIDEAYLDVTRKTASDSDEAKELAKKIKNDLKDKTELICSIGIGPNKLMAKMAADYQKPDGLIIIKPERAEAFLAPLPVNRLVGVGTKTAQRMQTLRISTIGDLAKCDVQELIAVFGKKLGVYFHDASLGIDDAPVEEKNEAGSISRIATLKHDTRDVGIVLQRADQLCDEIHAMVMQQKLTFKTVGINAVMVDMSIHTRSKTLENATNEAETLRKAVEELFAKLFSETELEARRVGVKVSGFVRGQQGQKQLTSYVNSAT